MSGEIAAARAHPAIIASVVVASVAVTACALVAIAWMVGWIPAGPSLATPTSIAIPGSQVAGSAPEVALAPGETLVEAPEPRVRASAPGPATPQYARQPEKLPAPAPASAPPSAAPSPSPLQLAPAPALTPKPRPAPAMPAYARAAPPPVTSYDRAARGICVNCGTVSSVRAAEGEWEVRVKFEDGSTETVRYPQRPRLRAGDRVHMEGGDLLPD
jgi:hypothetical protein